MFVLLLSDPCENSPCANGGICTAIDQDYECTCAAGWSGWECQCKYNLHNILPKSTIASYIRLILFAKKAFHVVFLSVH